MLCVRHSACPDLRFSLLNRVIESTHFCGPAQRRFIPGEDSVFAAEIAIFGISHGRDVYECGGAHVTDVGDVDVAEDDGAGFFITDDLSKFPVWFGTGATGPSRCMDWRAR